MSDSPQRKKRKTTAASQQQEDTPAARALRPWAPSLSGLLPVCFLRASTYVLTLPSQMMALAPWSTTTSIAAAPPVSLVDLLNDDSLRHIVSFCDAFSLGFLERSCKKFSNRPRTMTESAWKHLDDQISDVSKYYHEGVDHDSNKTSVVRFVVAARLADQVQPHIASHRHCKSWYEDEEEEDDSRSDKKAEEYCTGCAHIPDQLDVTCFSPENSSENEDEDHYDFFLRIFSKSDQRIMWQGFMGRSTFWENYVQLVFRGGFDPVKDFPEFTKVLDTFEFDNDNDRKTREDFFDAVGLIVVAYNESAESAKLVCATTQLATKAPDSDEEDSESDTFRGIPVRTHSLPRDGGGESEEDLHTYVAFSAPTAFCRDWHFSHRGRIPQFVLWYSAEW